MFLFKTGSPQCNTTLCEEGILYPSVMEKLLVLPTSQMPAHGEQQTKQHDEGIFPSQMNQVCLQYKVKVQLGKGKVSSDWLTSSVLSFLAPCVSVDIAVCKENPHISRYSFSCSFMFCGWLAWCCSMRIFHNISIFSLVLSKVGDDWCFSQSWAVFTMHKNVAKYSVSVFL